MNLGFENRAGIIVLDIIRTITRKFDEFKMPERPPEFGPHKIKFTEHEYFMYREELIINELNEFYDHFYEKEIIKIKKEINEFNDHNDDVEFEKWITINYRDLSVLKGKYTNEYLLKLKKDRSEGKIDYFNNLFTEHTIISNFKLNFINPLLEYFEETFREILVKNSLAPSLSDPFLDAISIFKVELTIATIKTNEFAYLTKEGKRIPVSSKFNGHPHYEKYYDYLISLFKEFKKYINSYVLSPINSRFILDDLNDLKFELFNLLNTYKEKNQSVYSISGYDKLYSNNRIKYLCDKNLSGTKIPADFRDLNIDLLLFTQRQLTNLAHNFVSEKIESFKKEISSIKQNSPQGFSSEIFWYKSDTDSLELIVSLIESGAINNSTKNLTRKDAIAFFKNIFNLQIKDAESKLFKAANRKKDQAPFLESLKKSFVDYCSKNIQ